LCGKERKEKDAAKGYLYTTFDPTSFAIFTVYLEFLFGKEKKIVFIV
jgi:hypothetical protein